jgi:hypothetical protein
MSAPPPGRPGLRLHLSRASASGQLSVSNSRLHGHATTPEQYLFESIVLPNVHVVEGFAPIMPDTYSRTLTEQDVADLIEYLMTAFD